MINYTIEDGWLKIFDGRNAVLLEHISTVVVGPETPSTYYRGDAPTPRSWQVLVRNAFNVDMVGLRFWVQQYDDEAECEAAARAFHLELIRDIARALK